MGNGSSVSERERGIFLADPTVFAYDGGYYLYGTADTDTSKGFPVYFSRDLKSWSPERGAGGYALKKGDAFGTGNFWAPQVFACGGSFYMAYTADEKIAVAKSSGGPLGPFRQEKPGPLFRKSTYKDIDPFIFIDDDGRRYLYYVLERGENCICVTEINEAFDGVEKETGSEKICVQATLLWENTEGAAWPVAEGPAVLKMNGWYYLFYSANDFRSADYAVGYAVSNSPLGPWKKQNGPILSRKTVPALGTGHGDFFLDSDRTLWYVFHTHFSENQPTPRRTALVKLGVKTKNDRPAEIFVDSNRFYYAEEP